MSGNYGVSKIRGKTGYGRFAFWKRDDDKSYSLTLPIRGRPVHVYVSNDAGL